MNIKDDFPELDLNRKRSCAQLLRFKKKLFEILFLLAVSATPGSDSPGQAMEAEEIMKQLDIEQAEEMPSSTLTSTEAITSCHMAPVLPQRLQISSDPTVEEGEIVTETDMPPLTGQGFLNLKLLTEICLRWFKTEASADACIL